MTIYVFPADKFGCGSYRMIWPVEAMNDNNIRIAQPEDKSVNFAADMRGDQIVNLHLPADAEAMVFQRTSSKFILQAIPLIRQRGIAVIIDMDDDLSLIHPANTAFEDLRPGGAHPEYSWLYAQKACEAATMVVATTPALLSRYAPHGRGRVFHNYIPQRVLDIPRIDSDVIGWAGSVHSHPDDLQVMGPAVSRLIREGFSFGIVGNITGIHKAWGVPESYHIAATGAVPLEEWHTWMSFSLGIGVAPLADTRFNQAKSWLKMAEYAALGIPCVGSPREDYVRLHEKGVGLLAKDPKQWYKIIKALARDFTYRQDISLQSREAMRDLTMEGNAWRLREIWQEAIDLERK